MTPTVVSCVDTRWRYTVTDQSWPARGSGPEDSGESSGADAPGSFPHPPHDGPCEPVTVRLQVQQGKDGEPAWKRLVIQDSGTTDPDAVITVAWKEDGTRAGAEAVDSMVHALPTIISNFAIEMRIRVQAQEGMGDIEDFLKGRS